MTSMDIRARKYGSRYSVRAAATASALPASRLKNQIPGRPPAVTYVRTFSSGKRESTGGGSVPRARVPRTSNGVTDTQARPSRRSSSSAAGTCGRTSAGATGQCANSRSCQLCAITHGAAGSSHGRWSVCRSDARWRRGAPGSRPTAASAASATGASPLTT